jgi:hypothetical protein
VLVLGVDPSLTATGYAWDPARVGTLRPGGGASGLPRIQWHREALGALVAHVRRHDRLVLVVLEGPSYGHDHEKFAHERAGHWWALLDELDQLGTQVAIAPPAQVKMMAVGKGNGQGTDKPAIVSAARERLGYRGTDNNEADALWLAALGYEKLGAPLAQLPQTHLRALGGVAWPKGL